MKIAVLGAGPAGLYFAISMKLRDASHEITVHERNRPDDTFGWGVVLSDETMSNFATNDPVSEAMIRDSFAYWDDVKVVRGEDSMTSGGHGFAGIGRIKLLLLLQQRARDLGVELRFQADLDQAAIEDLRATYDLVVAADGLNSRTRQAYADRFGAQIDMRRNHFVWLGTRQKFDDAFTFIFEKTEHGWIWAHAYQFDADTATFIVECGPETFDAFGFADLFPGRQHGAVRAYLRPPPGRPQADVQRQPHLRLRLDPFPPRHLRELVFRQCRAAGRCLGDRAFLDRLGVEAGHGKRHCAGR